MPDLIHSLVPFVAGCVVTACTVWFVLRFQRTTLLEAQKQSAEAALEREFLRGKAAGAEEELARFEIRYQPILIDDDGFWNHSFEAGYEMQLHYAGLPVGDPTRRITHEQQKSNDENILKTMEVVTTVLLSLAKANSQRKISTAVSKEPQKAVRKK